MPTNKHPKVPEAKKFGEGDPIHVQAQRIWLILVAHVMAEYGGDDADRSDDLLISYGELAKRMGVKHRRRGQNLGNPLGLVGEYCRMNDLPTLNSIVIRQDTGVPGDHVLMRDGKTYKEEQREVAKTDWFEYRVPTTGTFRKVREHRQVDEDKGLF